MPYIKRIKQDGESVGSYIRGTEMGFKFGKNKFHTDTDGIPRWNGIPLDVAGQIAWESIPDRPTKLSDFDNDLEYEDIDIPTKVSDLENDLGFQKKSDVVSVVEEFLQDDSYYDSGYWIPTSAQPVTFATATWTMVGKIVLFSFNAVKNTGNIGSITIGGFPTSLTPKIDTLINASLIRQGQNINLVFYAAINQNRNIVITFDALNQAADVRVSGVFEMI